MLSTFRTNLRFTVRGTDTSKLVLEFFYNENQFRLIIFQYKLFFKYHYRFNAIPDLRSA